MRSENFSLYMEDALCPMGFKPAQSSQGSPMAAETLNPVSVPPHCHRRMGKPRPGLSMVPVKPKHSTLQ